MRVAIFGDIHGNIEALKVAYEEALRHNPDRMYHLGDLGGYAPFVNEVVEFLIAHQIEGVQGNYDEAVANDREHCGCKYEDPLQAEMASQGFNWTKAHATAQSKDYMRKLPFEIRFEADSKRVIIFHATPKKNNLYWYEDRQDKFFKEMADKVKADVLIYGHTHKPYRKDLFGKVFINAGSVGRPKDGDNRTCVTVIDITKEAVKSEFVRIPYDVEKVASAIILSGLPAYFAESLKKAK